jgi:hypothetical protein
MPPLRERTARHGEDQEELPPASAYSRAEIEEERVIIVRSTWPGEVNA